MYETGKADGRNGCCDAAPLLGTVSAPKRPHCPSNHSVLVLFCSFKHSGMLRARGRSHSRLLRAEGETQLGRLPLGDSPARNSCLGCSSSVTFPELQGEAERWNGKRKCKRSLCYSCSCLRWIKKAWKLLLLLLLKQAPFSPYALAFEASEKSRLISAAFSCETVWISLILAAQSRLRSIFRKLVFLSTAVYREAALKMY